MSHPSPAAPRRVPPVFVVNAAMRLRRLLLRLADAVVPPHLAVLDRQFGAAITMLVHTAARLRLADLLADGPRTAGELAASTDSDPDVLERALRALVAFGLFRREADGRFANNRVSRGLRTGVPGSARGFAEFFGMAPILSAWSGLGGTLRAGGTAFARVHGRSAWDWLDADPAARAAFAEGMGAMTEMVAPAIAAAYPFGEVTRLCDVGGGVGAVLAEVLARHPHLAGVLLDGEIMLRGAPARLDAAGVRARVELVPGSFFDAVPRGADAYLLKTVLHNWDDAQVLRVLKNCRAAMEPGHRLLAVEFIDEPDAISTLVPAMDILNMLIFQDGRERTVEHYRRLFDAAGFDLGRVIPLPGCQSILEGRAR